VTSDYRLNRGLAVGSLVALLASGCGAGSDGVAGNGFTGSGGSHEPPRGLCRDGWCWINPTPQGRTLSAITAVGANDWWVVGDLGTTLHSSPQGTTLDIAVPSPHGLRAVWSAAADDVWAIGDTAMRWQGQGWNAVTSAAIPASLNAVGGTGPDDVWLVGSGDGYTSRGNPAAGAAHYDGANWTAVPMDDLPPLKEFSPRFSVLSLYAAAADDVWFSTDLLEAPLIHYDGQSFSWVRAPVVGTLSARILCLAGRGPLDAWAAGEGGTVLHFDGAWHDVGIGVTVGAGGAGGGGGSAGGGSVVSLALPPDGDVIALDDGGTIRRWHDQQWSVEPAPAIASAVAADLDGNLLAVGADLEDSNTAQINGTPNELASDSGAVYRFNRVGTTWSQDRYIKASNPDAGDRVGTGVAIVGSTTSSTLVVGAQQEDSHASGLGGDQTDNT